MAEKVNDRLKELTKWPTSEDEVTVDGMLRIVGADTQRAWLRKQQLMDGDRDFMKSELYHALTTEIIGAVGLMSCLRFLRIADPAQAEAFARDYWSMCDAGDSFGELLWEFTEEAGLDPDLIKLDSSSVPAAQESK